jgi:ATP-dependent DNA helicase RecG
LPDNIKEKLDVIGKRTVDKDKMNALLIDLCTWKVLSLKQLSSIVQRNEKYLLENFITPLREAGALEYTIPDMPNHPDQSYKACKKNEERKIEK